VKEKNQTYPLFVNPTISFLL